jgi:hypothetical protein
MTQALGQMSGVLLALWGIVFLLLAIGLVWALRIEARRSRARGRFAAWVVFRVLTLPLLALVLWLALQPARAVSGMEGLAYAYGGLLVLGPTLWFGSHVLLGWLQRPTLKAGESIEFAGFGLLFVLGPVLLVASLQAPVFLLAHAVEHGLRSATPSAAAAHRAGAMRRFHLGEGTELLSWSLHAPAGLRVERLEMFCRSLGRCIAPCAAHTVPDGRGSASGMGRGCARATTACVLARRGWPAAPVDHRAGPRFPERGAGRTFRGALAGGWIRFACAPVAVSHPAGLATRRWEHRTWPSRRNLVRRGGPESMCRDLPCAADRFDGRATGGDATAALAKCPGSSRFLRFHRADRRALITALARCSV